MIRKTLLGLGLAAGLALASAPAKAEDALVTYKAMKPSVALELATITLETCRDMGYQVAVAVVDRFGNLQVMIRDQFAGAHTLSTAERKAWTAVSFRTTTLELGDLVAEGPLMAGLRDISNALALGGGVPVEAAGSIVGGVGVSGAPGPDIDDDCAKKGIEEIQPSLDF
ncbi:MAG: heme-binding protein [Alphaproteobacteria bacterium]|nr:heme-binding protein [Alphaproteobacteria bacterium]